MSTITKEFTKEQLQQIEAAAKEVLWPVVWSEKKAREHFSEKITPKVVLKLARIALASLEAEAVPVSMKDHQIRELVNELRDIAIEYHGTQQLRERIARTVRAAMLQGAEPVTTACKLPANTPCKDAPEHIWLQTAGIWPENGEFSELTWCSDNQHPDDTLYVRADVVAGNSPVIPDGWKLVPIELTGDMTNAMSEAILDDLHNVDVWRSVLAAAPQQEVK
ncbi:DUF551 domain-containing protein [Enterobacter kobei]|uniref:DUF551 domain-containing protein n=1 Tax=Enterobacter kobei TaxID=208224 RepID=UPI001FD10B5A|nr:DUF551 domain-containing protein [Enterobacter kobei]